MARLTLLVAAAAVFSATAHPKYPSCKGPKIKTHGDMLDGKPFDVVPHSPLVAGHTSKVSLVGFTDAGASFKGYLINPDSGAFVNGTSGAVYVDKKLGPCGWGHNEASVKTSVDLYFTPDAVTSVTFTGFVLTDMKAWYGLSSTIPVALVAEEPVKEEPKA